MTERFRIKKSSIRGAGDGLFVRTAMAKGNELAVRGTLMKRNSITDRCTRYADAYKFRVGSHLLLSMGWECMINHSSDPNLVKVVRGKTLFLRAIRPILSGEELFFRYGRYAQNRFYKNRRQRRR